MPSALMILLPVSDPLAHRWPLYLLPGCVAVAVRCVVAAVISAAVDSQVWSRCSDYSCAICRSSMIAGPSPAVSNRHCLSCSSLACLVFFRPRCCPGSVQGHMRMLKARWSHAGLVNGSAENSTRRVDEVTAIKQSPEADATKQASSLR